MNWAKQVLTEYDHVCKSSVLMDTFGHLAPKRNVIYTGIIWYCTYDFGHQAHVINFEFDKGLTSSPWLFESIHEYIESFEREDIGVFEIRCKLKNYTFSGNIKKILHCEIPIKDNPLFDKS